MRCKTVNRSSGAGILPARWSARNQSNAPTRKPGSPGRRDACLTSGFTLAEVLAAMLFMAIVIPVAVAGLRVAAHAGEVANRRAVAVRIADRVLNELILTGQAQKNAQSGVVQEGPVEYSWNLSLESWDLDSMQVATVTVSFPAQGQNYDVRLSTLMSGE